MKKLYSIPKALAVTAGLDLLLLGLLLLFTHMVHKESGQALLFLTITLLLTTGICLFAAGLMILTSQSGNRRNIDGWRKCRNQEVQSRLFGNGECGLAYQ